MFEEGFDLNLLRKGLAYEVEATTESGTEILDGTVICIDVSENKLKLIELDKVGTKEYRTFLTVDIKDKKININKFDLVR